MSKTSKAGYRRPPAATRFQKGRSGNPKGRPRNRHNRPPYDAVLGQTVTIKEEGVERRVTAAEAFLLYMTKRGLEGDGGAARAAMEAIEPSIWFASDALLQISNSDTSAYLPSRTAQGLVFHHSGHRTLLRGAHRLDHLAPRARVAVCPTGREPPPPATAPA